MIERRRNEGGRDREAKVEVYLITRKKEECLIYEVER